VLAVGLGCNVLAYLLAANESLPILARLALLGVGTVLLSVAVVRRLRTAGWDVHERLASSAMISLAGLGALCGYGFFYAHEEWDSGLLFFAALFIVALCGALLVALPPLARRVALSLILLFHFGGMVTAVTSVDPPGGTTPYLPKQLWSWVYRPYLTFMYMTNAYHFYSPEPGPPSLLWFAVKYSDGAYTWVKLPDRENSPVGMHYQRLVAMPEHCFQPLPRLPFSSYELVMTKTPFPERGSWEMIYSRREQGSRRDRLYRYPDSPREAAYPIPLVSIASLDIFAQYREPQDVHKKILAGVAQRILHNAPHREGVTAQSVKMYRIVHQLLSPQELAEGFSPMEKIKYVPYFMGEFDHDGKLIDPYDPFLYWYLPITIVPPSYPEPNVEDLLGRESLPVVYVGLRPKGGFLLDCLEMHAAGLVKAPKEKK
jgi:hypothetical protein